MKNNVKIKGIKIEGIYGCIPSIEIDNLEELKELCGESAKSIVKATGIKKRYLVKKGTSSLDLCCASASKLIEDLKVEKDSIGAVIAVTFTPENLLSGNAVSAQAKLGLPEEILAFDISLGCSGYGYGLYVSAMIAQILNQRVLLLDGDVQSAYLSGKDKATVPVLADAGSATLIATDQEAPEWCFSFYTDGANRDKLIIPAGGSGHPVTAEDLVLNVCEEDGSLRRNVDIYMDGFAIFRFVATTVAKKLKAFIKDNTIQNSGIDYFVPHQANIFMVKRLAKEIGFSGDNTWLSGDDVGNSGSATVPVTIAKNAGAFIKTGTKARILLSGFGAGLSISCGLIELSGDAVYKLFQYQEEA